jgi:FtsP/CotA-like multicopper oxidase with cupredoxin domain
MKGARRALLALALSVALALVAAGASYVASQGVQRPQACDDPDESITLFAEKLGRHRYGYGLRPGKATVPGPTIEMTEGDCIAITLVNDADKRLSLHAHGVDYTVASDGTPLNDGCVAPGKSLTYIFSSHVPAPRADGTLDPGSAGYWHYHDHCLGSDHGTDGIRQGLFGALIVRRAGDPLPDRPPFVLVFQGTKINGRRAPATPTLRAKLGERVEFVVIGHGELFHTFHLHGHRWVDNRTGVAQTPADLGRLIDNKTIGPADSFGFQVIAGEGVGPGAWMYHCHVQGHSDAGMAGLFVVSDENGVLTQDTVRAIRRFESAARHYRHGMD